MSNRGDETNWQPLVTTLQRLIKFIEKQDRRRYDKQWFMLEAMKANDLKEAERFASEMNGYSNKIALCAELVCEEAIKELLAASGEKITPKDVIEVSESGRTMHLGRSEAADVSASTTSKEKECDMETAGIESENTVIPSTTTTSLDIVPGSSGWAREILTDPISTSDLDEKDNSLSRMEGADSQEKEDATSKLEAVLEADIESAEIDRGNAAVGGKSSEQQFDQNDNDTSIMAAVTSAVSNAPSPVASSSAVVQYQSVDIRVEVDIMSTQFQQSGSAAGDPLVFLGVRDNIADSFLNGNLDDVTNYMGSIIQVIHAKSACADARIRHLQQSSKRISLTFPKLSGNLSLGEILQRINIANDNEYLVTSTEWDEFNAAIARRNKDLEKSIQVEKYCNMSRSAKTQLIVIMHICVTIKAMSLLRLFMFCDDELLEEVRKLREKMQTGENCSEMSMKDFTQKTLIPAINSSNNEVVVTALRITCKMREAITDAKARPVFVEAQQTRADGRGNTEGSDYCGAESDLSSRLRLAMLNLFFSLVLARRIEDEFERHFFSEHGGFIRTMLRGSWRDVEHYCHVFPKKEFFTSLGYKNDKTTVTRRMKILKEKRNVDGGMPVVIFEQEQMDCLQNLVQIS